VGDINLANIDPSRLDHWVAAGKLMREFNSFVLHDPRVDVVVLPIFDGISEIRWSSHA